MCVANVGLGLAQSLMQLLTLSTHFLLEIDGVAIVRPVGAAVAHQKPAVRDSGQVSLVLLPDHVARVRNHVRKLSHISDIAGRDSSLDGGLVVSINVAGAVAPPLQLICAGQVRQGASPDERKGHETHWTLFTSFALPR